MRFTQSRIAALQCPNGKRDALYFDDEQRGLGVRVMASGSKSFLVQYTIHGQKRRIPLGSCAGISLARAREAARAVLGEVAKGADPAQDRKAAAEAARQQRTREALTLGALIADWGSIHLSNRRINYSTAAVRSLRYAFGPYLDLPAAEIDRAIIVKVLDSMSGAGKCATAAQTAAYGKAAYNWAMQRGALAANPFAGIPVPPPVERDRVLADDEVAAVWRASTGAGVFGRIVQMLILTGQRREEVGGMAWAELSADLTTWTIPASRAKNGVAHIVPLSPQVQDLLRGIERSSDLVFPGLRGAFSGWSKAKAALDARSGVSDWRLHDLRRTMATGLQRLGVRLEVTEQILNHVSGSRAGIVGVYQRHDFADEKRAALTAWGEHVAALVAR